MKINLSKKQWQIIGNKAGWLKTAQATAQGVGKAFEGAAQGVIESGKNKVQEYVQRIMNGEPKEQVLQGIGPTMVKNVEAALAQAQAGKAQQPQAQQPQAQQPQAQQPSGGQTFNKLMQDPNFKQTFETIQKQRANEKKILQYWESAGINYRTIPEIVEALS